METSSVYVGIDVAQEHLEGAVAPSGEEWRSPHDEAGIAEIVFRLQAAGRHCVWPGVGQPFIQVSPQAGRYAYVGRLAARPVPETDLEVDVGLAVQEGRDGLIKAAAMKLAEPEEAASFWCNATVVEERPDLQKEMSRGLVKEGFQ